MHKEQRKKKRKIHVRVKTCLGIYSTCQKRSHRAKRILTRSKVGVSQSQRGAQLVGLIMLAILLLSLLTSSLTSEATDLSNGWGEEYAWQPSLEAALSVAEEESK